MLGLEVSVVCRGVGGEEGVLWMCEGIELLEVMMGRGLEDGGPLKYGLCGHRCVALLPYT